MASSSTSIAKPHRILRWSVLWSLGLVVWLTLPIEAQANSLSECTTAEFATAAIVDLRSPHSPPTPPAVLKELSSANVVYLGETHDRPADHTAELAIIQALHCVKPRLAIGMEMFQRPYQSVLDRYLSGNLTELELQDLSQYQKRWGFSWEFYAPILRFARENRLPVIALNTPTEVTRKVSRTGLESLTRSERRFIPPASAIFLGPEAYRQRLHEIYAKIHHGKTGSGNFDYFFEAQVLWDETMAERIAQIIQQTPEVLVVVLIGQGHLIYGNGFPARVARRLQSIQPNLTQVSVLLNPPAEVSGEKGTGAEYFWYSR
ncbi:MAG: ChaN family lipoprotein [Kovacikia sp.]